MADFSASEAIGTGFQVIRRSPLSVLIWAGAYLVFAVVPMFAILAAVMPDMIGLYQQAARGALEGVPPSPDTVMGLQGRMMTLQPLILLITIVTNTILVGAIYRAVLQPQDSKFGYLRVGRQELWLGLTGLVFYILMILMMIVAIIPVAIVSAIAGMSRNGGGAGAIGLIAFLLAVAACATFVWVVLRLSMAIPMSFAQSRFVITESWALTRGHALKMFLVALALVVIVWLLEMLLFGIVGGVVMGQALGGGGWNALLNMPPAQVVSRLAPLFIGFAIVGSVLGMALYAIMIAPWAYIYAQLTTEPEAETPATETT